MHPASPDLAEDATLMYDLASVIVHKGRDYTAGHYVAVCCLEPAEGICPIHANEGLPNLPQAVASVACTLLCSHLCRRPELYYVICCSSTQSTPAISQTYLGAYRKHVTVDAVTVDAVTAFAFFFVAWSSCVCAHQHECTLC